MDKIKPIRSVARQAKLAYRRGKTLLEWKRWNFAGVPYVFGNAIPKSGSHLLLQILEGLCAVGPFAYVEAEPIREILVDGRKLTPEQILANLARIRRGTIGWGYLPAYPEFVKVLNQPDWTTFFIIRDPRDALISQIFYATEINQDHRMRGYYLSLPDMDSRLRAAIGGVRDEGVYLPDILRRYERFKGWFNCPEVMVIRFEDFRIDPQRLITSMIDFLERKDFRLQVSREQAMQRVIEAVQPKKSPTFRKGHSGEWRNYFKEEHRQQFKQVAGNLLVEMGYEQDESW
jgi:hypothetical protein